MLRLCFGKLSRPCRDTDISRHRYWDKAVPPFRSHLPCLLYLTGIFFLNFLARVVLAPLLPAVERDLTVGHGEAGSLFLFISLGYCLGLLGSGFVSSRFTHRRTIILSSMAVGGSLIAVSLSHTLWWVRSGLILLGLSGGLYLPSGIVTLTTIVNSKDWGKALAVHELAPNLGFIAAPLLAEGFMIWFSWRGVLALVGGAAFIFGVAFARFGMGGAFSGETLGTKTLRILLPRPSFWIMVLLFSMGIGASLGVYTMLPLYLVVERGLERGWANTLVAVSRIAGLGVVFLAGWATDQLGPRRALGGVFLTTGVATVLLGVVRGGVDHPRFVSTARFGRLLFPGGFRGSLENRPSRRQECRSFPHCPRGFSLWGRSHPSRDRDCGRRRLLSPGNHAGRFVAYGKHCTCTLSKIS